MSPPHLILIPGYMLDETMWDDFVARLPPAYTVERLPDSGHMIPMEQPERLASAIVAWIEAGSAEGPAGSV